MAVLDRLGATVSATEAPSSSTPNAGLAVKTAVRAATTGTNITLSGLQTMDGVALAAGDRVLVKDQTDATTNGIFNVGVGQWAASSDFQNNTQVADGLLVTVTDGAANAGTLWHLSAANPVVLGSSSLLFGRLATGRRLQRAVRSSADLPVRAADQILNFLLTAPLTVTVPSYSTRNGEPLTLKNLAASTANVVWQMTAPDEADTLTGGQLAPAQAVTLVPAADGVSSGYAIQ